MILDELGLIAPSHLVGPTHLHPQLFVASSELLGASEEVGAAAGASRRRQRNLGIDYARRGVSPEARYFEVCGPDKASIVRQSGWL